MTRKAGDRLQKILALLDSPHEAEAIAALLMLRAQLAQRGRRLSDLLPLSALHADDYLREIATLKQQLVTFEAQAVSDRQAKDRESAAALKWRRLAETTADRLWDIGRQLHEIDGDPASGQPAAPPTIRRKTKQST